MAQKIAFFSLALVLFLPSSVFAHAFGQSYSLPLPLWLYTTGAGLTLAVSFGLIGLFFKKNRVVPKTYDLNDLAIARSLGKKRWLLTLIRLFVLGVFGLAVTAGLIGTQDPSLNLVPTLFWVIIWVGTPLLSAILGNIWQFIDPWSTLYYVLRLNRIRHIKYPVRFGIWPALLLYMVLTWLELVSVVATAPVFISGFLISYTIAMLVGAGIFGEIWFAKAEVFGVIAQIVGSASPFSWGKGKPSGQLPGSGLLSLNPQLPGLLPFVVFFISGVTYDGIRETTGWYYLLTKRIQTSDFLLRNGHTVELFAVFAFLFGLYYVFILLVKLLARANQSVPMLAKTFAPSLVPIAVVYTIAHYYTLLVAYGQSFIALLSNPFGQGTNYFGTAGFKPNLALINPAYVWYLQLLLVVAGHIIGVYIAHIIALKVFQNYRRAMASQYPMLALMIGMTMMALWILSAPYIPVR